MAEDMDLNEDFIGLDIELNVNLGSAEERIREAITALNGVASKGGINLSIDKDSSNKINSLANSLNKLSKVNFSSITSGIQNVNSAINSLQTSVVIDISLSGDPSRKIQNIYNKLDGAKTHTDKAADAFGNMADASIRHIDRQSNAIDALMAKMKQLSAIKVPNVSNNEYAKTSSPSQEVARLDSGKASANVDVTGLSKKHSREIVGVVKKFMTMTTSEVFNSLNVSGFSLNTAELGNFNPLANQIAVNMKKGAESALKTMFHEATHLFISQGLDIGGKDQLINAVKARLQNTRKSGSGALRQLADKIGMVYRDRLEELSPEHIEEIIAHAIGDISQTGKIKAFGPEIENLVKKAFGGLAQTMHSLEDMSVEAIERELREVDAQMKAIEAKKEEFAKKIGGKSAKKTKAYQDYKNEVDEKELEPLVNKRISLVYKKIELEGVDKASMAIQEKVEDLKDYSERVNKNLEELRRKEAALVKELDDSYKSGKTVDESDIARKIAEIQDEIESLVQTSEDIARSLAASADKASSDLSEAGTELTSVSNKLDGANSAIDKALSGIIGNIQETEKIIIEKASRIKELEDKIKASAKDPSKRGTHVAQLRSAETEFAHVESMYSTQMRQLRSTGIRGQETNNIANIRANEIEEGLMSKLQVISQFGSLFSEVKAPAQDLSNEMQELANKTSAVSKSISNVKNEKEQGSSITPASSSSSVVEPKKKVGKPAESLIKTAESAKEIKLAPEPVKKPELDRAVSGQNEAERLIEEAQKAATHLARVTDELNTYQSIVEDMMEKIGHDTNRLKELSQGELKALEKAQAQIKRIEDNNIVGVAEERFKSVKDAIETNRNRPQGIVAEGSIRPIASQSEKPAITKKGSPQPPVQVDPETTQAPEASAVKRGRKKAATISETATQVSKIEIDESAKQAVDALMDAIDNRIKQSVRGIESFVTKVGGIKKAVGDQGSNVDEFTESFENLDKELQRKLVDIQNFNEKLETIGKSIEPQKNFIREFTETINHLATALRGLKEAKGEAGKITVNINNTNNIAGAMDGISGTVIAASNPVGVTPSADPVQLATTGLSGAVGGSTIVQVGTRRGAGKNESTQELSNQDIIAAAEDTANVLYEDSTVYQKDIQEAMNRKNRMDELRVKLSEIKVEENKFLKSVKSKLNKDGEKNKLPKGWKENLDELALNSPEFQQYIASKKSERDALEKEFNELERRSNLDELMDSEKISSIRIVKVGNNLYEVAEEFDEAALEYKQTVNQINEKFENLDLDNTKITKAGAIHMFPKLAENFANSVIVEVGELREGQRYIQRALRVLDGNNNVSSILVSDDKTKPGVPRSYDIGLDDIQLADKTETKDSSQIRLIEERDQLAAFEREYNDSASQEEKRKKLLAEKSRLYSGVNEITEASSTSQIEEAISQHKKLINLINKFGDTSEDTMGEVAGLERIVSDLKKQLLDTQRSERESSIRKVAAATNPASKRDLEILADLYQKHASWLMKTGLEADGTSESFIQLSRSIKSLREQARQAGIEQNRNAKISRVDREAERFNDPSIYDPSRRIRLTPDSGISGKGMHGDMPVDTRTHIFGGFNLETQQEEFVQLTEKLDATGRVLDKSIQSIKNHGAALDSVTKAMHRSQYGQELNNAEFDANRQRVVVRKNGSKFSRVQETRQDDGSIREELLGESNSLSGTYIDRNNSIRRIDEGIDQGLTDLGFYEKFGKTLGSHIANATNIRVLQSGRNGNTSQDIVGYTDENGVDRRAAISTENGKQKLLGVANANDVRPLLANISNDPAMSGAYAEMVDRFRETMLMDLERKMLSGVNAANSESTDSDSTKRAIENLKQLEKEIIKLGKEAGLSDEQMSGLSSRISYTTDKLKSTLTDQKAIDREEKRAEDRHIAARDSSAKASRDATANGATIYGSSVTDADGFFTSAGVESGKLVELQIRHFRDQEGIYRQSTDVIDKETRKIIKHIEKTFKSEEDMLKEIDKLSRIKDGTGMSKNKDIRKFGNEFHLFENNQSVSVSRNIKDLIDTNSLEDWKGLNSDAVKSILPNLNKSLKESELSIKAINKNSEVIERIIEVQNEFGTSYAIHRQFRDGTIQVFDGLKDTDDILRNTHSSLLDTEGQRRQQKMILDQDKVSFAEQKALDSQDLELSTLRKREMGLIDDENALKMLKDNLRGLEEYASDAEIASKQVKNLRKSIEELSDEMLRNQRIAEAADTDSQFDAIVSQGGTLMNPNGPMRSIKKDSRTGNIIEQQSEVFDLGDGRYAQRIREYEVVNGKLGPVIGSTIKPLRDQADALRAIGENAHHTNKNLLTFIGHAARNILIYGGLYNVFFAAQQAFVGMLNKAGELEQKRYDIIKILDERQAEFSNQSQREGTAKDLQSKATEISNIFGKSSQEVMDVERDFIALYKNKEQAIFATVAATKLAVATNIELTDSSKVLVSISEQFGLSARGLDDFVDSLNQATNLLPTVRADDLVANIQRVGPLAEQAGVSVDKTIALTALGMQKFGANANEIGNSLKTFFAFLGESGKKDALADFLGIDTFELHGVTVNETIDKIQTRVKALQEEAANLSKNGREAEAALVRGRIRDFFTEFGGAHQAARMAATFSDKEGFNDLYDSSTGRIRGAQGSAAKEAAIVLQSFENTKNRFVQNAANTGALITEATLPALKELMEGGIAAFSAINSNRAGLEAGVKTTVEVFKALGAAIGGIFNGLGQTLQSIYVLFSPIIETVKLFDLAMRSLEDTTNRFIGGIARMVGMEYPFDPATRSANGLNKALGETLTIVTQLGATMALSQLLTGAINLPGRNSGNRANNNPSTRTNNGQDSNPVSSVGGAIASGAAGTLVGNVANTALESMFDLNSIPDRDFDEYRRQTGTNIGRRRRGRNFRNQNNDSGIDSLTSASTSLSDIFKRLNPNISALTTGFGGLLNIFKNFVAGINPATITITAILAVANHFYKKIKETIDMLDENFKTDDNGNKLSKAAVISMDANDILRESKSIDAKPRKDKDGNIVLTPEQESRQRIDNAISALEEKQKSGTLERNDAIRLKDLRDDKKKIASKDTLRRDAEKELEKAIKWKDTILQNIHVFGGEGSHWYTDALNKVEEKSGKLKEVLNSNKDAVDAMVKAAGDIAKSDTDLKIEEAALQSSVDEFKKVKDKLKFSKFIENAKKRFEEIVDAGQAGELSSGSSISAMRTMSRQNTQTFAPFKQLFEDELVKVNKRIESFSITGNTQEEREKQQQEFNELLNQQQTIEGNLAAIRQQEVSEKRKILELQSQIRKESIDQYKVESDRRKIGLDFHIDNAALRTIQGAVPDMESLYASYRENSALEAKVADRVRAGANEREVRISLASEFRDNYKNIEQGQLGIKNRTKESTNAIFGEFSGMSDTISKVSSLGGNGAYDSAIQSELGLIKLRKQYNEQTIETGDLLRQGYELALNREIRILDITKQRKEMESRSKFAYSSLYGEYGRTEQAAEESRLTTEDLTARRDLLKKSILSSVEPFKGYKGQAVDILDDTAIGMELGSKELDEYLESQKGKTMSKLEGMAGNSPHLLGLSKKVGEQLGGLAKEETNALAANDQKSVEEIRNRRDSIINNLPGIQNNKEMMDLVSSLWKISTAQEAINKLKAISLGITEEEAKKIQNVIDANNQDLEIENRALRLKKQGADIAISRSDLTGNRMSRLSNTSYSYDLQLSELENNKKGVEFKRAKIAEAAAKSSEGSPARSAADKELLKLTSEINGINNQIESLKLDKIKAVRSEISEIIRESAEAQSDMRDISDLRIGIQENIADMSGDNGILSQSIFSQQRKSVKIGRLNDQISDLEGQRQRARILGNKTEEARIDRSILKLQLKIEGVENELNPLQRQLVDIAKDFGDNLRNAFATAFSKALASPDLEKIKDIELNIKDINLQRDDYKKQLRDLDTAAMDSIAPPDEAEKMRREAYDRMEQRNRIAEQDAIKAEELRKKERELAEERNPLLKFGRTLREEQDKNRQESTERLLNVVGEVGFDALTNPAKAQDLANMMKAPEQKMQDASIKQFSAAELQAKATENFNLAVSRLIEAINSPSPQADGELSSLGLESTDLGLKKELSNRGNLLGSLSLKSKYLSIGSDDANKGTENKNPVAQEGFKKPEHSYDMQNAFGKDTRMNNALNSYRKNMGTDESFAGTILKNSGLSGEEIDRVRSQYELEKSGKATNNSATETAPGSGATPGTNTPNKNSEFLSNYGMSGYMGKGLINTGIGLTSALSQIGNGQQGVAGINIAGAIANPLVTAGSEEMLKMWAGNDKDRLSSISNPINGAMQTVGGQLGGILSQLNRQNAGVSEDQRSDIGKASAGIGGSLGSTIGGALGVAGGPIGIMLGSALGGLVGDTVGEWAGDWMFGGNQEKKNKEDVEKAKRDAQKQRELENESKYQEELARSNEYLRYQKSMIEWQKQAAENAKVNAKAIQATGETFKSAGELIKDDINLFGASALISGRYNGEGGLSSQIGNSNENIAGSIHAANGAYLPDSEKYNGIPATLHKGELVLPREISQGMIDIIRNNGVGAKDANTIARSYVSDYRSTPQMDIQNGIQEAFGKMVLPELKAKVIADVQMPEALPEMQVDVNARVNMPELPKQDLNINVNNNQSGNGSQNNGGSGMSMNDIERQNQINRSRGLS